MTTLQTAVTIRSRGTEPEITITTPTRDLMRDTIDPLGMDVSGYLSGTRAVNFAHDHGKLPIGKTLTLTKSAQGIRARFKWLEANPEARLVRDVFEEGVLGASVEFVPVEQERIRDGGVHYAKSVLTGWALTANPANPECVRMMKSLGLGSKERLFEMPPAAMRDEIREAVGSALKRIVARTIKNVISNVTGRLDYLDPDDDDKEENVMANLKTLRGTDRIEIDLGSRPARREISVYERHETLGLELARNVEEFRVALNLLNEREGSPSAYFGPVWLGPLQCPAKFKPQCERVLSQLLAR